MELRPSDVWLQASRALGGGAQAAGQIGSAINEADRVMQVNQGLAYYERAFQEYQTALPARALEVSKDAPEVQDIGGAPSADWSGMVQVPLGQATKADLDADYTKFVNSQVEYVQKTFRNRAARQELLQHLQMGAIANREKALQTWNVAADHEAMASFNNLYGVIMASSDTPDDKVRKISVRVDEMVRTGRMWKDTGEQLKAKAMDSARYSFAYNGAMTAMKESGELAQGEAWLKVNTPFYEGNPDARAKVLNAVRDEYQIAQAEETKNVHGRLSLMNNDYVTREATLREHEILSDPYLRSKGNRPDVAQFIEKWVDTVRRRNAALNKGVDATKSDPAALEEAYRILAEPFLADQEKLDRIQLVKGLTATDYATKFRDVDLSKYRDPEVQTALRDIDSYYKPRLAKVNEKAKPQEWTDLNNDWNKSKDDLVRALGTLPPKASDEQKREAIRQVTARIIEKYVFHAFTQADLGFGDRGTINSFEQNLIDAAEGKKFANVQFRYSEDLIRLGEGIKTQLSRVFAKAPDNVWDEQLQGGAMTLEDGRTAWMFDGILYTLRADRETKDEILQRYDPRVRKFEDLSWTPEQWARIKPLEAPVAGPFAGTPPLPEGPSAAVGGGGRAVIGGDIRELIPRAGRNLEDLAAMTVEQLTAEMDSEMAKGRGASVQRIEALRQELARKQALREPARSRQ